MCATVSRNVAKCKVRDEAMGRPFGREERAQGEPTLGTPTVETVALSPLPDWLDLPTGTLLNANETD